MAAQKPGLVIFDCDGVLVDSEHIANAIIADAMSKVGLPISAEEAFARYQGGKLSFLRIGLEEEFGLDLGPDWVEDIYQRQFDVFRRELKAVPGIADVLERLKASGVPVCVGSNGPPHKMDVTLAVTDLLKYFGKNVFSADMVGIPKPAPDLYQLCAERMGVPVERCVVIEDSTRGATAGVVAGMSVFGFAADTDPERLRAVGCSEIFYDMAELPQLLGV